MSNDPSSVEFKTKALLVVDGFYATEGFKALVGFGSYLCAQRLVEFVEATLLRPDGVDLVGKIWIDSIPGPVDPRNKLKVQALEKLGFRCPEYRYRKTSVEATCPIDGHRFRLDATIRGAVDVGVAVSTVRAVVEAGEEVSDVVLFVGDGDVAPLVADLQRCGKRVRMLSFKASHGTTLRSTLGKGFLFVDDVVDRLIAQPRETKTDSFSTRTHSRTRPSSKHPLKDERSPLQFGFVTLLTK